MDIAEVLKLADELIFAKTGEHIDYLQKAILEGTFQGRTYQQIADATHSSEGHTRDIGSELWQILSEGFGEEITKRNFRAILKKGKFCNFSPAIGRDHVTVNNNLNVCPERARSPTPPQNPQQTPTQLHIDLGDAPQIFRFFDRTPQLSTLENWITRDRTRLIALLGISGIGKTTLSLGLINQIKTQFDYIIYRSLRFSPTLDATLTNLLQIFPQPTETPQNIDTKISQLLNHLRNYRCLIVLDDVQMLFCSGQPPGQYKSDCEDYQLFFKLIAEVCHQSCLMLNSSEKPREIVRLEKAYHPVRSFELGSLGIAAKDILNSQKLSDEETWETLIDIYQGNPLWLELTATLIRELFGGRVAEFLQCEMPILDEGLQSQLSQQFQRLTQPELAVVTHLASQAEPVAVSHFFNKIPLSPSEIVNAVRSLRNRFLLDAIEEEKITLFSLNPVLRQYVHSRYVSN
ncbi:MAG: ATP-binding protein [Microcoleus sp. PH2017_10_PVI_O_A]|uniref:AAA family ATPase n=1 Tax=unclassified Microcoleus TaxID=2642155 RepID=UPI001D916127|nr:MULTISPECIES: AAA family ATPase [unclassified Microcoleus]TAE76591.1 MAG: NACHT domain-containing protein [Oscillatoriales cyanobacterium]MCC3408091.1 ATP-binding protein [Microcoleus sp. PH2017_10_PVI_O_A]MCC3462211.1 ATP-binding protein [Microcoleus sp. PH2017_11_PCY_U_A]MCC3480642.1 ATP-binding protein [Microcoleus sp. PH2017_12_PCY_D_A]MCC3561515.1 ATP-binding protein [Microcoleus sp. PH2017_27_LUM_O_A]